MKEKLAEEAALREGYYQSDKTQYTVTPWMNYNLFVRAFIAGWEAKEASIGGDEVERKIISDFNAWAMEQDVFSEDFNDVLNDYFNARKLNSPLPKEGDEASNII